MPNAAEKARQEKRARENVTLPYMPVEPLQVDATRWLSANDKKLLWRLGNKAWVEEITKSREAATQRWRWRLCKLGGETAIADTLEKAMRAAEFALGIGEMPVGGGGGGNK